MIIDYHMHLERGGLSMDYLMRFIEIAGSAQVDEIGITEHGHNFIESQALVGNPEFIKAYGKGWAIRDYVDLIESAKAEGLPVKLGIEMDYILGRESEISRFLGAYPWDYVIGSVHWLDGWGFDICPELWVGKDVAQAYRTYAHHAVKAIRSGLFDVLGHADVVKLFGHRPQEADASEIAACMAEIVLAASEEGVCLEASTAGLRRPVGEIYPGPAMIRQAAELGVGITLASDAHDPEYVGSGFHDLVGYVRAAGHDRINTFTDRQPFSVPLCFRLSCNSS